MMQQSDQADQQVTTSQSLKGPPEAVVKSTALVSTVPDGISLPCVLPQTSKSFRGSCFSPFVRAYVPQLAAHGIDRDTFVSFIDGLNEAYVAHPVFEAVNIVSSVVSIAVPIPDVQFAFGGVAIGAIAAGRVTTYARTKAYVKAVNAKIFHPGGLHVSIMTTPKMMEAVSLDEETLSLPALNTFADIDEEKLAEPMDQGSKDDVMHDDDPRMRRMRALEGYVMPLDFNVPPAVSPDNFFKRIGDSHAQWLARKQQEKLLKKREKDTEKYHEKQDKIGEKRLKGEQEVAKLERKLERENERYKSKMDSDKVAADSKEGDKVMLEHDKETAKLVNQIDEKKAKMEADADKYRGDADKQLLKGHEGEEKIARKIRWVVIEKWNGEEDNTNLKTVTSNSSEIEGQNSLYVHQQKPIWPACLSKVVCFGQIISHIVMKSTLFERQVR